MDRKALISVVELGGGSFMELSELASNVQLTVAIMRGKNAAYVVESLD